MNITDVGHLVSDEDEGEDKLQKGAKREGKTAWQVAELYTEDFLSGMKRLSLIQPNHITKATDFIDEQLNLVRVLKSKGLTYQISDGIYFDTAKFPNYADFARLNLDSQQAGARVSINQEKRNQSDFALWKFSPQNEQRDMEWPTPTDILEYEIPKIEDGATAPNSNSQLPIAKMGFPGWHLECSAMAMNILGDTLDIHTGGIDHIPVHHTNEIAQSEGASGVRFSNFWLHNNHLKSNGTKISKSLQNGYTLDDLEAKGYSPLDYRMFVLQGHYQSEGNFSFENLSAARQRRRHWRNIAALRHQIHDTIEPHQERKIASYATRQAVVEALNDNLNTPEALRVVDDAFDRLPLQSIDSINRPAFINTLEGIDELLGLNLISSTPDISDDAKQLILERERAREDKNWSRSDELRQKLHSEHEIDVQDTKSSTLWSYAD